MAKANIYLDYAAATPVDKRVMKAMEPFYSVKFHNPSALYGPAVEAKKELQTARSKIAQILGAKAPEIIFTAGATEANNLAIWGTMNRCPGKKLVISAIEHDSVTAPAMNFDYQEVKVDQQGLIDLADLENKIDDQTALVSVMYANNEVGTVQPIKQIAEMVRKIRKDRQKSGNSLPLLLHTDAAQAGNYLDLHVHRLGVDLMTVNGGKIYGPKQSGALYVRAGTVLDPLIRGGGQERGLRSGTENVASAVGLAEALCLAQEMRHEESKRLLDLREYFAAAIKRAFPKAVINGSLKHRLPNNLHITFPGQDNERLLMTLDSRGIYAASGSACSASHEEPSHVLSAMGVSEADVRSSVRFSWGRQTTKEQLDKTLKTLQEVLA